MANIQNKNIDLLQAYKLKANQKTTPNWVKYAIAPIVLVVLFGGAFTYHTLQAMDYQKDIDAYKKEHTELQAKVKKENIEESLKIMSDFDATYDNLSKVMANLSSYPRITKQIFEQVMNASAYKVSFQGIMFDEKTGSLILTAVTKDVNETASFVNRLKETQAFTSVVYDGYREITIADTTEKVETPPTTETTPETTPETKVVEATPKANMYYQVIITCFLKAGGQ